MTSSYWFQGGEAPTPDLGFPIDNSLRLRENAYLERTNTALGDNTTFTYSCWIKSDSNGGTYFACDSNGAILEHLAHSSSSTGGKFRFTNNAAGTSASDTLGSFRDSSGWYNVVHSCGAGVLHTYVNGVEMTRDGNNLATWSLNDIGVKQYVGANRVGAAYGAGLIAEANFIDGQALEPTAFGRFNDEGIWVPIEIDFAMNGPAYSDFLSTDGDWNTSDPTSYGPKYAFTGSATGSKAAAVAGGTTANIYFNPSTPIEYTSKVEVMSNSDANIYLNGVFIDTAPYPTVEWVEIATGSGTIDEIELRHNSNAVWLNGIRVDGVELRNSFFYSSDVFTTPDSSRDWNSTDLNIVSGNYPPNGFDGDVNSDAETGSGSTIFWRPSTPLTGVTKIEIFAGDGCDVFLNEVNTVQSVNATRTTIYDGGPITLETLGVSASARPRFSAIWINDQLLIDGQNSSYGVNGFRLDFSDPNDIGADRSGNGNHFTPNGINVDTLGTNYDHFQDTPTNNWCTLNPERVWKEGSPRITEGALKVGSSTPVDKISVQGTQSVESGKWYYEVTNADGTTININAGWASTSYKGLFNTDEAGVYTHAMQQDKTMMVALDLDNGFMWFGQDGVWDSGATLAEIESGDGTNAFHNGVTGDLAPCFIDQATSYSGFGYFNFGQKPFLYQVPTGFKSLNTQNKPKTSVDGSDHFRVLTGPGPSILSIAQGKLNGNNGTGFQRGLWWIKALTDDASERYNNFVDHVRGPSTTLRSPLDSFADTDYIAPTGDAVAWCWKAGNTIETNNDGSIETQVSANVEGGFSIVSYSGTGAAGATIGHGLGKKPDLVIIRNRTDPGNSFRVWNPYIADGSNYSLYLDMTLALTVDSDSVQAADDSTITIATDAIATNRSGNDYICYAWTNVPGYSSIGTYIGNGDADGPLIRTDFTPAFVMVKRMNGDANWQILDAGRTLYNPSTKWLEANTATAEQTGNSYIREDFNCNGFKTRGGASTQDNLNNEPYLYVAFAAGPFAGKNNPPATAAFTGPVQYDGLVPGVSSSLRFRGKGNNLYRTQTAGNRRTFTYSAWFKKSNSGKNPANNAGWFELLAEAGETNNRTDLRIEDDVMHTYNFNGGSKNLDILTTSIYRDPSAWYHLVWSFDTTQATDTNRVRFFVNGVQQTYTGGIFGQNERTHFSEDGQLFMIGDLGPIINSESRNELNGYLADVYFIDGQSLDATEFGQYVDGTWRPKDVEISDYGTNGFHLVMDPAYQVGDTLLDQSGNGNDFTMSGFETSDFYSSSFDFMKDSPTQNFATLNPIARQHSGTQSTLTDANLSIVAPGGNAERTSPTIGTTESTYFELFVEEQGWGDSYPGIRIENFSDPYNPVSDVYNLANAWRNNTKDQFATNNAFPTWTTGDVVRVTCNPQTLEIGIAVNNGAFVTNTLSSRFTPGDAIGLSSTNSNGSVFHINYGQQPFSYAPPAGFEALQTQNLPTPAIPNGRDHFQAITGPGTGAGATPSPGQIGGSWSQDLTVSGYSQGNSTLYNKNLAFNGNTGGTMFTSEPEGNWTFAPTTPIPVTSSIKVYQANSAGATTWNGQTLQPNTTYIEFTGSGEISQAFPIESTTAGTGGQSCFLGAIEVDGEILVDYGILPAAQQTFPQGLWWIKDRANSNQHQLVDSVRNAETGTTQALFCPNPKTVADYIAPAGNSVAWCWSAPDAWASTDADVTAGTVASSGRRNLDAGFSIVRWQAPGFDGTTRTVGHGLSRDPDFIIGKNFSVSGENSHNFAVYVRGGTPNGEELFLETSEGLFTSNYYPTPPLNGVITIQDTFIVDSGHNVVAYCWHSVPGYSAFGSYTGNGDTSGNGPFIYTGFRPAWVMIKCSSINATNWVIDDAARSIVNPVDLGLQANEVAGESSSQSFRLDFLSNGFKVRSTGVGADVNRGTLIYAAFAENPFNISNAR